MNFLLISQSHWLLPSMKALGGAWLQARRGRSGRASGGGGAVAHTALPQPAAGGAAAQPGARDVRPSRVSACSDHACPDVSLAWRAVSSVAEHCRAGTGRRRAAEAAAARRGRTWSTGWLPASASAQRPAVLLLSPRIPAILGGSESKCASRLRALAAESDALQAQARAAWQSLDERSAAAHELEARPCLPAPCCYNRVCYVISAYRGCSEGMAE